MHQAWPILDCSRDIKAERERNRRRARQRGRERRSQWLSPRVCACLPILSTNMYCKCLDSSSRTHNSPHMLMLQCPWPLLCEFTGPLAGCRSFNTHIFHCWAVHSGLRGAFGCPTRALVVWCTRQSEGCVGWAKTGESFNISSGLQRTAEGLECFQMALQQKQAL